MLNRPPPWSSTTEFPPKNCSPANATAPSAIATTGVPARRSTSTPAWGLRGSPLMSLRTPNPFGRYSATGGGKGEIQAGGGETRGEPAPQPPPFPGGALGGDLGGGPSRAPRAPVRRDGVPPAQARRRVGGREFSRKDLDRAPIPRAPGVRLARRPLREEREIPPSPGDPGGGGMEAHGSGEGRHRLSPSPHRAAQHLPEGVGPFHDRVSPRLEEGARVGQGSRRDPPLASKRLSPVLLPLP